MSERTYLGTVALMTAVLRPTVTRRRTPGVVRATTAATVAVALAGCSAPSSAVPSAATAPGPDRVSTDDRRTPAPGPHPSAPSGWGPTEGELAEAAALAEAMSVDELAAAVLMPGFWGYSATQPSPVEGEANRRMHGVDSAWEAAGKLGYGSFFLRPEVIADATQVGGLAGELQEVTGDLPALLSIDQEGGVVQRLSVGVEAVPSAAHVGSTGDLGYARQVAVDNGESLASLGVTMVLAPVADVDPDGTSALGSRTYAADPEKVADMVVATVEGYLAAGIIPVVKHFPGLGSVDGDSHLKLPVQERTPAELEDADLSPFEAAVRAGAPVVMTGHVAVQAVDPDVPASLSQEVVQGLLRDDLGFEGVAVTDSHGMGPVYEPYGSAEGAVLALLAGNDLVLNSPEPRQALEAVREAVLDGQLPEERLAEAATRVLALRLYLQRLQEQSTRSR